MAEVTTRFPTQFLGGWYWRADISRRTDAADPPHFDTEWTGSITNPPASSWQYWNFRPLVINAMNDSGLFAVDNVEFEFGLSVQSFLDPATVVSAAIRLWWSTDAATWVPVFWGEIDLGDVDPETIAIVAGSPHKVFRFTARDSISKLNDIAFTDKSRMDDTTYIVNHSAGAFRLGDMSIDDVVEFQFPPIAFDAPGRSIRPSGRIIHVKYYLEQLANKVFDERDAHTVVSDAAYYGYAGTFNGALRWFASIGGSYPGSSTPATVVEKDFHDLHFHYDLFSNELTGIGGYSFQREDWTNEYKTWGDCLSALMYFLGFAVTTRHGIESGRWVRSLQYVSIDGDNGLDIEAQGVLLSHKGPRQQLAGRKAMVTTRFMNPSIKVNDFVFGDGPEKKFATWFRSIGGHSQNTQITGMNGLHKANVLWNVPLIKDGSQYRYVQGVKLTHNSTYWPYAATQAYPAWATNFSPNNGIAIGLGHFYGEHIFKRGKRIIQERRSRLTADDGATISIEHMRPFARMDADEVMLTSQFRLMKIELDPESGNATLTKEEI